MNAADLEDMSPMLLRDGIHMFCGEKLGEGMSRKVYVFEPDPKLVIKVETGSGAQNVIEMETWLECKDGPMSQYLARCVRISPYHAWLLMERTTPPPPNFKWPDKHPGFLTDHKRSNYGLDSTGRLVCHDYGTNLALSIGTGHKRMRRISWWS